MDEIKSAREIAQERASRLGKLSAEENRQQERQRCRQIGQVLAQKWLDPSQETDMPADLNRHEEEDRDMVRQAVIEHLVEAIDLADTPNIDRVKRAIEGIRNLGPELQPKLEEMSQLVHEYEGAEHRIRQELEGDYREILHRLRISGTAIGDINMEANPQWQPARQRLIEAFDPRFNDFTLKLLLSVTARPVGKPKNSFAG